MNETIKYYNQNAALFCEDTLSADMKFQQERFLSYLAPGSGILDAGCGSGRDSRYFLGRGFDVDAFDASEELCRIAGAYIGRPVRHMTFQELCDRELYDGIWASASLLHVSKAELPDVLQRLYQALKPEGIFYASFKYGTEERYKGGRFFNDYTEDTFEELLNDLEIFRMREHFKTEDARPGHKGEYWLNVILEKLCFE